MTDIVKKPKVVALEEARATSSSLEPRRRFVSRFQFWISILSGLIIWELLARFVVTNDLVLAPPSALFGAYAELARTGVLWSDIATSVGEFLVGYGLAAIVGIGIGLIFSVVHPLRRYFEPWLDALYATPTIALAPLFIIALGIGPASKIAIVFVMCVFPIIMNTVTGALGVDRKLVEMGQSFGVTGAANVAKIRARAAVPTILAGMRIASARGLVGVVVGEMFGAQGGIGYRIINSSQVFRVDEVFAGIVILALFGILLNHFFRWLEHRSAPWRTEDEH